MRDMFKKILGDRGERVAARYLRKTGMKILARQYRTKAGEIDLIARDGETLVFVEVKTRQSAAKGHPIEAVSTSKQQQLTRLALAYLKRRNLLEHRARFDVVTILWPEDSKRPDIEHFRNAFSPSGFGQMFS